MRPTEKQRAYIEHLVRKNKIPINQVLEAGVNKTFIAFDEWIEDHISMEDASSLIQVLMNEDVEHAIEILIANGYEFEK